MKINTVFEISPVPEFSFGSRLPDRFSDFAQNLAYLAVYPIHKALRVFGSCRIVIRISVLAFSEDFHLKIIDLFGNTLKYQFFTFKKSTVM